MALTEEEKKDTNASTTLPCPPKQQNFSQHKKPQLSTLAYLYGKWEPRILDMELTGSIRKEREARYVAEEFAAFEFPFSHLLLSQEMKETSFVEGGW